MQLRKPSKYGLFVSVFETSRAENRQILAKKLSRNKFNRKNHKEEPPKGFLT